VAPTCGCSDRRRSEALARARARLAPFGDRVTLEHANFRDLARVAARIG